VSNLFPASILQEHPHCICYLDTLSSALLNKSYLIR
jgi:6-phosphogluconolactonase/glucosamine-6-phosphate isomerase/deaminase